jgi:GNAT superfamily N-acetyltransferase
MKMETKRQKLNIVIKTGNNEDLIELQLCANDFIDFIDDFEINLQNEKYFILTAYYFNNLSGVLLAENNHSKVNALVNLVPKVKLIFLYVNPAYRNNKIGSHLLRSFIKIQRERKIAAIYINLPRKYTVGKKFLEKYNFFQIKTSHNNIVLERTLWCDFGIDINNFSNNRKFIEFLY